MKSETKRKLLEAWQYCDDEDKSTEFMLEYMQDFAGVDLDCVINFIEKTTDFDRILSPVVLEAIQNDAQIKALNQRLNDLYKYSMPKYVMQTNGEINAVNTKEFDEAVSKIVEQIELRQQQIMSAYNWR